jgi:hypothetical protein
MMHQFMNMWRRCFRQDAKGIDASGHSTDSGVTGRQYSVVGAKAGKFPHILHILHMPKMASSSMFVYSIHT